LENQQYRIDILKEEGCEIAGLLHIRKIPGKLKISTDSHQDEVDRLYGEHPDLSHRIDTFQFGHTSQILHIHESSFAPLDEYYSEDPGTANSKSIAYEYYLKVVPTIYNMYGGQRAWQFTASTNCHHSAPVVSFRYDFSPLAIIYSTKMESFTRFLAEVLAIIGAYISLAVFCFFLFHSSFATVSKTLPKARKDEVRKVKNKKFKRQHA